MNNNKILYEAWYEVFSNGDVYLLRSNGKTLKATYIRKDPSDFPKGLLVDNGVATVQDRAKMMGLKLKEKYGKEDEKLRHYCPNGMEYVKGFHKKDGSYVKGFCRKIKR